MKRAAAFFLAVFLSVAAILNADEGGLAMPLAMQSGTARSAALGSAYAGLAQGASALLWNPAGLGVLKGVELGLHHASGLAGTADETALFGFESSAAGGFALAVNYTGNGLFEKRDNFGNLLSGENSADEFGGRLGWGKKLFDGFYAGAAIKTGSKTLADSAFFFMSADAGILWEAAPFLTLGAAYINMGGAIAGFQGTSGLRAGAACTAFFGENLSGLLLVSGESHSGGQSTLNAGIELKGFSVLSARIGCIYNFSDMRLDGLNGITAGLGLKLQGVELDYAYAPSGDLGGTHRISLVYSVAQEPLREKPAPEIKKTILPRNDSRVLVFELVHFEFDRSAITPEARVILEKSILILKNNPDTELRIAGFTSLRGGEEYNQKLSERRAYAIRNFLIRDGGIPEARLTIIGFGDTNPAVLEINPAEKNSSAAKLNRRAVFEIVRQ